MKNSMKKLSAMLLGGMASLVALAYPIITFAVWNLRPGGGSGPDIPAGETVKLSTLETWIGNIADFFIYIGMFVAVIFIIWGGITYMAAGGDPEKATKAKTRLFNGIVGALIVLGVGLILNTIQYFVQSGVTR